MRLHIVPKKKKDKKKLQRKLNKQQKNIKINKFNGKLRNEEIALMAIQFRIRLLFTLILLTLNGSILSGEQIFKIKIITN